ncbi:MAG: alkyl hydroperoxide reductase [marine bacterium B5-7]|nr:MAG: alkyl hydroperoxide reductase [marine bacterium B5-7]
MIGLIHLNIENRMIKHFVLVVACTLSLLSGVAQSASLSVVVPEMPIPQTTLLDLDGKTRSVDEFVGKVIVVNFWATWCPPCLKELPSMQALWEKHRESKFVLLAINIGEDAETVRSFLASFKAPIDFPVFLDEDLTVVKNWPVFGLPTTFIVDPNGTIRYKALGERDWEDSEIEQILLDLMDTADI